MPSIQETESYKTVKIFNRKCNKIYLYIRDDELSEDVMRSMAGALEFDTNCFVNLLFLFVWPILWTFILKTYNTQIEADGYKFAVS